MKACSCTTVCRSSFDLRWRHAEDREGAHMVERAILDDMEGKGRGHLSFPSVDVRHGVGLLVFTVPMVEEEHIVPHPCRMSHC